MMNVVLKRLLYEDMNTSFQGIKILYGEFIEDMEINNTMEENVRS
jgi:hypothetical protein